MEQADPAWMPLTRVINSAILGKMPELFTAVRTPGRGARGAALYAEPSWDDDDLSKDQQIWLRLTGEPLGNDVLILGSTFDRERLVVPREFLKELLDAILAHDGQSWPEILDEPTPPRPEFFTLPKTLEVDGIRLPLVEHGALPNPRCAR